MMPTARRAIVWQTSHSPRGLVERVDFATSAGASVLVTPLAVFVRPEGGRFALASYRPDQTIESIIAETGFAFDATGAAPTPGSTADEERELELLDPNGVLDRIFTGRRSGTRQITT